MTLYAIYGGSIGLGIGIIINIIYIIYYVRKLKKETLKAKNEYKEKYLQLKVGKLRHHNIKQIQNKIEIDGINSLCDAIIEKERKNNANNNEKR